MSRDKLLNIPAVRFGLIITGGAAAIFIIIFVLLPCLAVDFLPAGKPDPSLRARIQVEYWEKWTLFEAEAMKEIVSRFNNSQDRIWVNYRPVSRIDERFLVAAAGNNAPDVAGLQTYMIPDFASKGALMPLDEKAAEYGIRRNDYIPIFWDAGTFLGRLYALPSTPVSIALHYNKRLFREAGIDRPPRTISELDEYAAKLTTFDEKGRIKTLGFSPNVPGYYHWFWGYFFGGSLWKPEGREITIDSPANINSFEWVQGYSEKYGGERLDSFKSGLGKLNTATNPFITERVAMELEGVWMFNYIDRSENRDLEWGVAPFPSQKGAPQNVTLADCDQLVVPSGAKHPDEAFEFIAFVQKQENMERLCLLQRKFTPLQKVSGEFWNKHPHPYIKTFYDLARSDNARRVPSIPVFQEIRDEMNSAFSDVWSQMIPPEKALAEVQERVTRIWEGEKQKILRRNEIKD